MMYFCYTLQLIAPPVNTRALAILSSVAGEALTKHLTKILPALLAEIKDSMGSDSEKEVLNPNCFLGGIKRVAGLVRDFF